MGGVNSQDVKFKAPGACHHARWLSKALYCLKIYLFRKQFKVSAAVLDSLRKICVFIVLFYVKIWFSAPDAIKAPNSDLQLIKDLVEYRKIHPKIANAALEKLSRHLWYLHEQLACLALFDNVVLPEEKIKIVEKMNSNMIFEKSNKHYSVPYSIISSLADKNISDFVTPNSSFIFKQFDLPYGFLNTEVHTWESNPDYQKCLETFRKLKVVNDVAERGVALTQKFNEALTHNENERQKIFQTVHNHRTQYPLCRKSMYSKKDTS